MLRGRGSAPSSINRQLGWSQGKIRDVRQKDLGPEAASSAYWHQIDGLNKTSAANATSANQAGGKSHPSTRTLRLFYTRSVEMS